MRKFILNFFIKNIIINIINYNYTRNFEIIINNILARNLFKLFNFEIIFEIILKNVFFKFFRYNRNLKI